MVRPCRVPRGPGGQVDPSGWPLCRTDEACEDRKELPSKAYGHAGCTSKWKQQPLDRAVATHPKVMAALEAGELVERWVGYDAREGGRVSNLHHKPPPYLWRAPLFEWDIDREQCREIIAAAGLPQPGKSSCWMCPMMRGHEIDALKADYPDLAARAVAMERVAVATAGGDVRARGLGMAVGSTSMLVLFHFNGTSRTLPGTAVPLQCTACSAATHFPTPVFHGNARNVSLQLLASNLLSRII